MHRDKVIEIFVRVDDFCQKYQNHIATVRKLTSVEGIRTRNRASRLCDSEIITIMIGFHLGAHKTFKHYYEQIVMTYYLDLFPGLVSYNRFIELQAKAAVPFMLFFKQECLGDCTGINFIDSTSLKVCHNRRIHRHRTFKGIAERGKTSIPGSLDSNYT